MPQRKSHKLRPFEIVMNETSEEPTLWDLEEHLNGCLAAYQIERTFGAGVALAFEALRGIARDVDLRARAHCFRPDQLDEQWIISPREKIPVPWIWIRALSTAWEKYSSEGGPLGRAFGLEGGQGKRPVLAKIMQMIDERAIAHWIWWRVEELRAWDMRFRSKTSSRKLPRSSVSTTSRSGGPGESLAVSRSGET